MMSIQLLPTALSELFAEVSASRRLTLADRYGLMAAMLDENLGEEEKAAIDRMLRSVRLGRVRVVEDLSQ